MTSSRITIMSTEAPSAENVLLYGSDQFQRIENPQRRFENATHLKNVLLQVVALPTFGEKG